MKALGYTAGWYRRHVVWVDICNTVIPKTKEKATEQALVRKGKKGWVSDDAKDWNRNLRGDPRTTKQGSWGTDRFYWAPMVMRGKVHVEMLGRGDEGMGDNIETAELLAEKIPIVLAKRFPSEAKPKVVMTDRGRGFHETSTGAVQAEFKAGLEKHGMRALQDELEVRPLGKLEDMMLHETAVSWLRTRLERHAPARPWEETKEDFGKRLKKAAEDANAECDVGGLCEGFNKRLEEMIERKGERISRK